MRVIQKIVSAVGRRVDESQPWVDARLADGSRVNVLVPPCAVDGPLLSIRKFSKMPLTDRSPSRLRARSIAASRCFSKSSSGRG